MRQSPLVSAITIFLNAEYYIEEAIQSVIAQSYAHWELLLVDDGSTDGSTEIAKKYARRYPNRIRYLEHPGHRNRGMSASRNHGFVQSRGDLIALLDADDVWLPHKLASQVAILEDHPQAGIVYDATLRWYTWTGHPDAGREDCLKLLGCKPETLVEPPALIPLFLRSEAETPAPCSVLIRRGVFEEVGGFEEAFRDMFEDQVFFYKICLKFPVFVAGGYTALYRQHPGSCCHLANRLKFSVSRRAFLDWLDGYLRERGIEAEAVRPILKRELWPYRHPALARAKTLVKRVTSPFVHPPRRS